MASTITLRTTKGSALTFTEMDDNFRAILEQRRIFEGQVTAGGTPDALTADFAQTVSLQNGVMVKVKINTANTISGPTLNVNATGAKTITGLDGAPLGAGVLPSGAVILFSYDSGLDSWAALNFSSTDALTLNGQPPSFYLDCANFTNDTGVLGPDCLPQATTAQIGGTRYATAAEVAIGTEAQAAITPDSLQQSGLAKPTFITPVVFANGTGSLPWTTYDAAALASVPSTATIILLDYKLHARGPDVSGSPAEALVRAQAGSDEYILGQARASGGGDEISWGGQGFFPLNTDDTFQLTLSTPGVSEPAITDAYEFRIVGYW